MNASAVLLKAGLACLAAALPLSIAGANAAWGLLLAGLLWRSRFEPPSWNALRGPLLLPLCAYLLACLLSALLGVDPARSLRYVHQDVHKLWLYGLLCLALASSPPRAALPWLALGFLAASLIGIGQSLGALAQGPGWSRAKAFVHPVTYGEQMAFAWLGSCAYLLAREKPFPERRSAAWGLFASCGLALLFSTTRGALLAAAAGLAALLLLDPARRRKALWLLPAALAGFLAMEGINSEHSFLSELRARERPIHGQWMRLNLWKTAWEVGRDRPLAGVGLNNYRTVFRDYFQGPLEGGAKDWGTAHNLYLHQFAERGTAGLAALLWLLGVYWATALAWARARPAFWSLWAFASATAFLVMNLTETAFQTEIVWMLALFLWLCAQAEARAAP